MDKVKEFLKWLFIENRYGLLVAILLYVIVGLGSCSIANYHVSKEYKQKQAACEHDWREIHKYGNGDFEIYCPKCQKQKHVLDMEWNRIQIDQEYRDKK